MKRLQVYFENSLVGILSQNEDLVSEFSYEDSWQKSPAAFPLSLVMPLAQKTYGNKITLSFFENLLPEGEVRESLERSHHVHEPFEFLKKFGQDCAGAITITARKNYRFSSDPRQLQEIDMAKVYEAIRDHESVAEVIAERSPGYLSLAGAQDKFPAIFKNGKFYVPTQGAPTTHIVKSPIWRSGVKESIANEFYCMELARAVGLPVPVCEIFEGDAPLFVIERYDRFVDGKTGLVRRLHQQDFCQAQGFTSENKYEAKGGPTLKDNYELILGNVKIQRRAESLNSYIDWICFNLLIGNNDSHSKNISLLLHEGKIQLAPFYDLLCTALYGKLKKTFSFKIGGRENFQEIGKKQFEALEDELGLKRGTWLQRLGKMNSEVLTKKDSVARAVQMRLPGSKIIPRISELIADRSKGLKSQKALE